MFDSDLIKNIVPVQDMENQWNLWVLFATYTPLFILSCKRPKAFQMVPMTIVRYNDINKKECRQVALWGAIKMLL